MTETPLPLNCPECGDPLRHGRSEGDTHYYVCIRHGTIVLSPHHPIRRIGALDLVRRWPSVARARWTARVRRFIEAGMPVREAEQLALETEPQNLSELTAALGVQRFH